MSDGTTASETARSGTGGDPVRLSANLSARSAGAFRALINRKGLTITEGVRRAIAVWAFVEDETRRGNQVAVIERDGSIRKVTLLQGEEKEKNVD
jgi:hypothetical protein